MKNKIAVSIDTIGSYLGLGFAGNPFSKDRPTFFKPVVKRAPLKQSDLLIPTLSAQLKKLKFNVEQIELIVVNVGPGSFTGVRIGVATGRALAQACQCDVVGVNSLEILAREATKKDKRTSGLVVACLPALAGDAYFAGFKKNQEVIPPRWGKEEDVRKQVIFHSKKSTEVLLVSRDKKLLDRFSGIKNVRAAYIPEPASPLMLLELGLLRAKKGRNSYHQLIPLYLQPSWAERKK